MSASISLEAAKAFAQQKIKEGHKSDGCTMAPDLDIYSCCEMHDMLVRFSRVPRKEADILLKKCIRQKKRSNFWRFIFKPIAYLYYLGVRLNAKLFGKRG